MNPGSLPACVERGQGDTVVVMLHGVGGGHAAFEATMSVLAAAGYRAVAWDAPGYGASPLVIDQNGALTMGTMADALLQLVEVLGARRTVVVGHSMGGMIAQEACFARPGRFDGLVLFATSAAFGKPGGDWQREFLQSRFAALDAGLGMAGLAPVLVGGMLALGAKPAAREAAVRMMASVPESTYRAALAAIVSFNRLENLDRIDMPVLCLACQEDKTAPPGVMEKMAGRLRHGQYASLANAGHLGNMEQPVAFNEALMAYLRQHFPVQDAPAMV